MILRRFVRFENLMYGLGQDEKTFGKKSPIFTLFQFFCFHSPGECSGRPATVLLFYGDMLGDVKG